MSTFNGAPGSLNANENKEREIAGNRKITNRARRGKVEKKKKKRRKLYHQKKRQKV